MPEHGKDEGYVQMVRVKKPKGNIAKSKMYESMSNFYCGDEKKLNDITFELLNDTVMRFILDDNKVYWPDTALMILQKKETWSFLNKSMNICTKGNRHKLTVVKPQGFTTVVFSDIFKTSFNA